MLKDLIKARQKKLNNFVKTSVNPYPSRSARNFAIKEVLEKFNELSAKKNKIILAGRLISKREHGGSTFGNIKDDSGALQLYFKQDVLGEKKYKFFLDNFDIGDFIEVKGALFTTKKGEKTLEVSEYKILAKALRPLPEKWHGLQDVEERFRKRYLDLLMNEEVKGKFVLRSKIIKSLREFLEKQGFMEVETPILQLLYGGATAKPFKTHLNALDMDLYLRIAPELYLKRLLVGGFEKIYEIGRCFRNEGMDATHNPDFTMLEFYWAYADYNDLMALTEKMLPALLKEIFGKTTIEYEGKTLNFAPPYQKITMADLVKKYVALDIDKTTDVELMKAVKKLDIKLPKNTPRCKLIDELYKKSCRPNLIQPTFVINHPLEMTPLAKSTEDDKTKAARFQLIAGGMELVNAFSELNDPQEQEARMKEQERHKENNETMPYDKDFIEALEYGMPPAAGFGLGIDRLVVLLTNSHAVREVILFPTMRGR